MLSKNQAKIVKSLGARKDRLQNGLFVVEGEKAVRELFSSDFEVVQVYSTLAGWDAKTDLQITPISPREMKTISQLSTAPGILAVARLPKWYLQARAPKPETVQSVLYLDGIRDPGNLGSIIRSATWFGTCAICASPDTVDCFNPKVVQASMGALFATPVTYLSLAELCRVFPGEVRGLDLSGESIYEAELGGGIVVLGSESHGIRSESREQCSKMITIPGSGGSESLNASVSAAIYLSELQRRRR